MFNSFYDLYEIIKKKEPKVKLTRKIKAPILTLNNGNDIVTLSFCIYMTKKLRNDNIIILLLSL